MRNKKRVLSGGVVVLTVFLVLGVCKPDIDKFCRQNRSITAFFASKGVDSFGEYLGGFMFDAAALGVCAVLVFLLLVISALVFITFRIEGRSSKPIRL